MFVSSLSEVDFFLSQVNILLSNVNEKLDKCSVRSRSTILPRIYHIVSELEWTMSLAKEDSELEDVKEGHCTYSGALSPPLSSCCSDSDTESLSWDHQDFYKLYYEDDADDEAENYDEMKCEDDDHGPIQFSASSHNNSASSKEELSDFKNEEMCEDVADIVDDCARFVNTMKAKIDTLAPEGFYEVVRPIQYTIDLTKVNEYFLRNIPKPQYYPVSGCSNDPEFYNGKFYKDGREYSKFKENVIYFESKFPFGGLFGYKTDVGIIPVPKQAVFGHVWTGKVGEGWVLQAQQVDDCLPAGGSWSPTPRTRGRPSG